MHDSTELSIVIVTWNSKDEIGNCLRSIIDNTKDLSYEIVIVDNDSKDKTVDEIRSIGEEDFHRIKLIQNETNTGYTKASNQGISSSSGKYILLLNPDTITEEDSIKILLEKLISGEKTGAAAPQLLNPDGSIQSSCRKFPGFWDMFCEFTFLSSIFPGSRIFSRWKMNYFDHNMECTVEQPMAAALMIRKEVLNNTGNFDERFKMFFNDVDLCRQICDSGYDIIFYPQSKIIHEKGVSIYKDREKMIRVWNEDCLSYFRKYSSNSLLLLWLGLSLKVSGFFRILFYKFSK
ncbi:MAG TPA: glycosyltransferase family 2 protein [Ignavibacteria bacterium]|nr:glycosyltransferase family 2 protein [Ignavibacteria bacterium]HMR40774.1 glycosyltransferase family 2 protein [Ignavibacteria bacterium]